jgi:cell division protein FtsL
VFEQDIGGLFLFSFHHEVSHLSLVFAESVFLFSQVLVLFTKILITMAGLFWYQHNRRFLLRPLLTFFLSQFVL